MSCPRSRSRSGCSGDEPLELGGQLRVTSERELGVVPQLSGSELELLEP